MLCHRHGEHLETWATQAEASTVSELRGFAKGLRKDWAAVTARLTVPYGHANRIKMIKDRCTAARTPDLLRKRVLLAD
jgi:transposase